MALAFGRNWDNEEKQKMGFLKDLVGVAAPIAGSIFGGPLGGAIGGAIGSAVSGSGAPKTQTTTQQQQLDPRIQQMLFGDGNNGLLSQYQSLLSQPQTLGSQVAGNLSSNYLAGALPDDVNAIRNASLGLINNKAPNQQFNASQFSAQKFDTPNASNPMWVSTPSAQAAQVKAPGQNNIDLTSAFQNTIYGNPAENAYLKQALQTGVDQSTQAFNSQLGNLTDTLQRQVLPGVRGGAIASGMYGGSRQGITEGLALSDYTKQATNAAQAAALANTAATTGAQANAFESGQNRALSALQSLSGQQYGVASQNAQMQQQANLTNLDADMRAQLANQAAGNSFLQGNQQAQLATNALNSQNQLATNQLSQQGQLATNQLNSQNALQGNAQNNASTIAGLGALQGLGSQMYGYNQNAQNADLLRAQGVNSLLSPYLSANSSSTTNSPIYQNQGANILGGAAAGLGLYNQFSNMFKPNTPASSGIGSGIASMFPNGY